MAEPRGAKTAKAVRKPTASTQKPARRTQNASRTSPRTTARTTPTDDYEGARQVLSRYCFALDSGKLDALGPLFHRDAVFAVSFESGAKHAGRDTIQAWYERFFAEQFGPPRFMRHKIHEPLLSVTGTTATASTYFDSDWLQSDGTVQAIAGRYDDVLVKEQGQWFFKDRTITVLYHYSPGSGQEGMV